MPDTAMVRAFLEGRHEAIAEQAAAFADREIASLAAPEDDASARAQARELLVRIGRSGLVGHAVPGDFGGTPGGIDLRGCALVRETLAAVSPLADSVFGVQCLGGMPLVLSGSAEQRERWLPAVVRGEAMAAFAMTEPGAGSDVAAIGTTARRDGDGYVIDGEKTLISNAGIADFYIVFATTSPAEARRGISAFLLEAGTPGLRFAGAQVPSAPHPLGRLLFEGVRVPASARIGAEGEGFKLGLATLDRLRPTVAAAACGMAERALHEALAHAKRRAQFGKPLSEHQLIRAKLAAMATDLAAARLLTYRAAGLADSGADREEVTLAAAMAKSFATEAAERVVDEAVQVLGGAGTLVGNPVERLHRAVRPLRIYEGTTEIQHLIIAGHLLRGGPAS
jgi:alkylation response protein AidB-like acyl-CoA dehydrogenase